MRRNSEAFGARAVRIVFYPIVLDGEKSSSCRLRGQTSQQQKLSVQPSLKRFRLLMTLLSAPSISAAVILMILVH